MNFSKDFLLGAATAAHQVEGNNINSDFWLQEQLKHSSFAEPSLDAVDHYHRYEEDIKLMQDAGLNAYRFSIEWARIEPEKGVFDEQEIQHYRQVLECCHNHEIVPIVTMHHFSSPKWLISQGGWEAESTVECFANYCRYLIDRLGDKLSYVCTINEVNMGIQLATIVKRYMKQMGVNLQVGMNLKPPQAQLDMMQEAADAFGINNPMQVNTFLSQRSANGDAIIVRAHEFARNVIKEVCPHIRVGMTLSLHDIQTVDGGGELAKHEWEEEFLHYLPHIQNDDFFGVQNYTREIVDKNGVCAVPESSEKTQAGYEFYPEALEAVIRRVSQSFKGDIIVTENGIATDNDSRRIEFIHRALLGVENCIKDGIPVKGYLHWSLLDNFEWQKGFSMRFGLVAVDRNTQKRTPKPSLEFLGKERLIGWE